MHRYFPFRPRHLVRQMALFSTQKKPWCVYALTSDSMNRSYVGATTDIARRLRQHNSEIKGGAKYTRGAVDWTYLFRVSGFENGASSGNEALQFEWALKHSSGVKKGASRKRRRRPARANGKGAKGRIDNLQRVLHLDKWKEHALIVTWCVRQPPGTSFVCPENVVSVCEGGGCGGGDIEEENTEGDR